MDYRDHPYLGEKRKMSHGVAHARSEKIDDDQHIVIS